MPIQNFPVCWREREDCEPLHAIDAVDMDSVTEEQLYNLEYMPTSFVCCGCINTVDRGVPRDAYRVCWKNAVVDEIGDYDEQDLAHMQAVISHALAVLATRRIRSGRIRVLDGPELAEVTT